EMEKIADSGRVHFRNANYEKAEKVIQPLCLERTVNQPLYQSELSSIYLLAGKKEKAHKMLMLTHTSLEGLHDQNSERRAASVWGDEAEKVYKGEPYERCSLYVLLAMSFLNQGDVDNALAAIKTGLLADSDSKENKYKVDYALLYLLAAKCYDIRKEFQARDKMLDATFNSFIQNKPLSKIFANELYRAYCQRKQSGNLTKPPAKLLRRLCIIASSEKIEKWLKNTLRGDKVNKSELHNAAVWAKESTRQFKPLDFNTLIVIWCGSPPSMFRRGEYGEFRIVQEGVISYLNPCSIFINGQEYDPFYGFGDINYQSRTRGARSMDQILKDKASMKKSTHNTADAMIAAGIGSGGIVGMSMALSGLMVKGAAASMSAKADIRNWQNLPHSFAIIPLKLPKGEHAIDIWQWYRAIPVSSISLKISVQDDSVCNVFHFQPPGFTTDTIYQKFAYNSLSRIINEFSSVTISTVDVNGDGELSSMERSNAKNKIMQFYDKDKNGKLSAYELLKCKEAIHEDFIKKMGQEEKCE
ncbi:MAG: hypothetical protein KAS17_12495, partial [Victivallaceae bacterium]|nr:hypothetical protein [Victivallaceae bacterium]